MAGAGDSMSADGTTSIQFSGGDKLKARLAETARKLAANKKVAAGFFSNATYASDGGARLAAAAKRITPQIAAAHPDWKPRLEAWAAWQANHQPTLHVAQVAFWNEFGTSTAPPRPFFRAAIKAHAKDWGEALAKAMRASEMDVDYSLNIAGLVMSEDIRSSLNSWNSPPNKPLTRFIKGFDAPLRDHAVMLRSVGFEVRGA